MSCLWNMILHELCSQMQENDTASMVNRRTAQAPTAVMVPCTEIICVRVLCGENYRIDVKHIAMNFLKHIFAVLCIQSQKISINSFWLLTFKSMFISLSKYTSSSSWARFWSPLHWYSSHLPPLCRQCWQRTPSGQLPGNYHRCLRRRQPAQPWKHRPAYERQSITIYVPQIKWIHLALPIKPGIQGE